MEGVNGLSTLQLSTQTVKSTYRIANIRSGIDSLAVRELDRCLDCFRISCCNCCGDLTSHLVLYLKLLHALGSSLWCG